MPAPDKTTAKQPTTQDCHDLLSELRLTPSQAFVGIGWDNFFVIIYADKKRPAMIRFRGFPIEYSMGGGMPLAYAGGAA